MHTKRSLYVSLKCRLMQSHKSIYTVAIWFFDKKFTVFLKIFHDFS